LVRGGATPFTFDPTHGRGAVWSPDGAQIIFASTDGKIYRKDANGGGPEEPLLAGGDPKYPSDWSRDGRFLLYTDQDPKTGADIWVLPDPSGNGALRFTNGRPGGYGQNGAIVSNFTFPTGEGLHVTFTTVTYRGDSGGAGGDGADGISFYLMNGASPPGIGAWGGSLAYSCSNSNTPHDGLIGGYLGLGIDEFGNFLNGAALMPGYTGGNVATGDNTALGYGYHPGRIGMRGAGSVAFSALNALNSAFYPATLSAANQQAAVQNTCSSGYLWNYSNASRPVQTATAVADYAHHAGIDYPVLLGEDGGLDAVKAFGMELLLPFSVFADDRGRVVAVKLGELHPDEAGFILDRVQDIDRGTLTLEAARQQIAAKVKDFAVERAKHA